MSDARIRPPSPLLLAAETRVLLEWPTFALRRRLVRGLPRGDGHPVIVVPGFGGSDSSTLPLRRALSDLGYTTFGWQLGRNMGMRRALASGMAELLSTTAAEHGKASLIGWSLGGVFARELARRTPDMVRRVFTLGSPINGNPGATNVEALFALVNRRDPSTRDIEAFEARRVPPPVPCVAIYSKSDGIVAWRSAVENEASNTENVEVRGTHLGYGVNPEVLRVIANRLVLP